MVHGPGIACGNAVLDWGFVQNEVFATIFAPEEFAAGAAVRLVALAALFGGVSGAAGAAARADCPIGAASLTLAYARVGLASGASAAEALRALEAVAEPPWPDLVAGGWPVLELLRNHSYFF